MADEPYPPRAAKPSRNGSPVNADDLPLPPHDIKAEIAFLGSLLVCDDPAVIDHARQLVRRDEFYQPDNQIIFDTLLRMRDQRQAIDTITLIAELTRAGVFEEIGGRHYIVATILGSIPSHKHYASYAAVIRETATRRKTIAACHDAIRKAYQPQAGQLVEEAAADAAALAEQLTKLAAAAAPPTPFRAISAGRLVDENPEPLKETIYGISRYMEVLTMIASSKARKSWLMLSLLLCFVARRMWLGMFATAGGRVLLIDNELHKTTIAFRIREVARGLGITSEEWRDAFDVVTLRGQKVDIDLVEKELRKIEPGKYGLIILDSGYKFYQDWMDENNNSHMKAFYCTLERCAEATGATICLVHHSPKGNTSARDVAAIGAGAGAQSRSADSILAMREHEEAECFVIDSVLRSCPPQKQFGVRWEYPIFKSDPLLDPTKLKRDPSKGGRPKKDGDKPAKPEAIDWTPERFVGELVTDKPIGRTVIEASAAGKGLSARSIKNLMALALHHKLMFKHGDGPSTAYATTEPDLFTGDSDGPRKMYPKEATIAAKRAAKLFPGQFTKEQCDLLAKGLQKFPKVIATAAIDAYATRCQRCTVPELLNACEERCLSEK